jgi:hypothetical protein
MNSAEFKELLLVNPHDVRLKQALRDGVEPDAELQLKRALAFESKLKEALEVPVPPHLAEQLLEDVARGQKSVISRRHLLSIAASVGLGAVAASYWMRGAGTDQAQLASACVDHLEHEPFAITRMEKVPPPLVTRAFAEHGVKLSSDPGAINYAVACPVGDYRALHLVTQQQHGPVTVLYMPKAERYRRESFRQGEVRGRFVPLKPGTMVLMAQTDRDFDRVEMALTHAIEGAV